MSEELRQLLDALEHFTTAMLVTHDSDVELRARPLSIADRGPEGALWFFTASDSGKVLEMERDARVAVVMQGGSRFVSISGLARLDPSLERRQNLWRESFRPWFPAGPEDPHAITIEVIPTSAELWDLSGTKGLRYALSAIGAAVAGKRMSDAPNRGSHVTVENEFNSRP